ncbi:MAG TPA: hypothetical protein VK203_24860 [Nostocaceae cyanobacterium]|nr:hypothetical protein [Nostocaceae cyanobacterium]
MILLPFYFAFEKKINFMLNDSIEIYSRFQVNEVQILGTKLYAKRLSSLFPVKSSLFPAVIKIPLAIIGEEVFGGIFFALNLKEIEFKNQ